MKKLWKNNRVLVILGIIILMCVILIVIFATSFFYNRNVSEYGPRLDDISSYPISSDLKKNLKSHFKENEHVKDYEYSLKGRVIYLRVSFDEVISLDDAKGLCASSLSIFDEDTLSYYDIEFVLTSDNFTTFGARNFISGNLSWNNNTPVEVSE